MLDEIERIKQAYQQRDSSEANSIYTYANPAFAFHMQEREWAILKLFRKENIVLKGAKILEVGCGTGHILQRLVEFGAEEAWGLELMQNRASIAKKRYPILHIQRGNAAQLPYGDSVFDLVIQFMCISSVLDEAIRKDIASEMWRVLRPGGVLLSYDLRPTESVYKWIRSWLVTLKRFIVMRHQTGEHLTAIKPLSLEEINSWNFGVAPKVYSLSLDFQLARLSGYSRLAADFLALIPWLRTSYLIVLHKPLR